jgi:hypothetical protein
MTAANCLLILPTKRRIWTHITVRGNLNGQIYLQNILEASVVPPFDNHPLNTRPVFMDSNARPHGARVVTDYLCNESITTLPVMRSSLQSYDTHPHTMTEPPPKGTVSTMLRSA